MVTYCCGVSAILDWSLRSRKGSEIFETIKEIHQCLELRGCKPYNQMLDDESSTSLRDCLNKNGMIFHFAPPHVI